MQQREQGKVSCFREDEVGGDATDTFSNNNENRGEQRS